MMTLLEKLQAIATALDEILTKVPLIEAELSDLSTFLDTV